VIVALIAIGGVVLAVGIVVASFLRGAHALDVAMGDADAVPAARSSLDIASRTGPRVPALRVLSEGAARLGQPARVAPVRRRLR